MGDFNSNALWDDEFPKDRNHSALVRNLDSLGLESAYHAQYGEEQGAEKRYTFFFHKKEEQKYHIDYCFLPKAWRGALRNVSVGSFTDWKKYSDHVPLVVDVSEEAV
jgi:endonuclease/exonuclease/phosphatase family metal-dependent hydrolase